MMIVFNWVPGNRDTRRSIWNRAGAPVNGTQVSMFVRRLDKHVATLPAFCAAPARSNAGSFVRVRTMPEVDLDSHAVHVNVRARIAPGELLLSCAED